MSRRISNLTFILIGIAAAFALVLLLAPNANPNPDGLEKVAADKGIDSEVRDHALADGPFADYGVSGVDNSYVATVIAGIIGIAATFAIGALIVLLARRARGRSDATPSTTATT